MAYGNYTPMGGYYQPPQQNFYAQTAPADMLAQYKMPYQQAAQPAQNGFIWVQGEEAAKAYLVAPGNTVTLWDSEKDVIYIKSADASGMPSMRILEYKDIADKAPQKPAEHACSCGDKFVAKEDFEALRGEVERLTKRIEATTKPKSKIMKHLEEDDDE